MTKVHKVTLLIVDHDHVGEDEIGSVIECGRYPNRCINPQVMSIETREVEWDDDHPLNKYTAQEQAFKELFE